jgi:hypothetical protein
MSRLALLPDEIMRLIVGFGGMNKHAEEALRAIQRRWRVARKIARRRAAYLIQDAVHNVHDETGIPRIRRFNRLRAALRHRLR